MSGLRYQNYILVFRNIERQPETKKKGFIITLYGSLMYVFAFFSARCNGLYGFLL